MSNFCQQARAINIGSNLQNAGVLRSLLGQLMPLVNDIRLPCDSPWSLQLASSSAAASNDVLDSFRSEVISAVDACVSAVKEKMRIFQKRVMRKTSTTPNKAHPPVANASGLGSPAPPSPQLSPGIARFRPDLQHSQNANSLPVLHSEDTAEKVPSSCSLLLRTPVFPPPLNVFIPCIFSSCVTQYMQVKAPPRTFSANCIRLLLSMHCLELVQTRGRQQQRPNQ
jgi:hypothetical protein